MLFGLDNNGVPSKAATIKIGSALPLEIANENLIVDMQFEEWRTKQVSARKERERYGA